MLLVAEAAGLAAATPAPLRVTAGVAVRERYAVADLDDVRQRLRQIADELADAAITALRDALAEGQTTRPEAERRITRARTAVEKALRELGDPSADVERD